MTVVYRVPWYLRLNSFYGKYATRAEEMSLKDGTWTAADAVEWTYERPEGDLIVFARTASEALETIREHGYLIVYPERLKRTGKTLHEHLTDAKAAAEREALEANSPESKRPIT